MNGGHGIPPLFATAADFVTPSRARSVGDLAERALPSSTLAARSDPVKETRSTPVAPSPLPVQPAALEVVEAGPPDHATTGAAVGAHVTGGLPERRFDA